MRPGQVVCRPVCRPFVLLVIGLSLLLSGCANTSQSDLAKAKAAGASQEAARQKDELQQKEQEKLAAEVKKLKAQAEAKKQEAKSKSSTEDEAASAPLGRSCGGNLRVGPTTSCAFAANVEAAFYAAGGGTNTVEVYSPITGRYYTMSCVAGVPSVCRGGNNAVVYIR